MATQFYNRYVPPTASKAPSAPQPATPSSATSNFVEKLKRKRDETEEHSTKKKRKDEDGEVRGKEKKREKKEKRHSEEKAKSGKGNKEREKKDKKKSKKREETEEEEEMQEVQESETPKKRKRKERVAEEPVEEPVEEAAEEPKKSKKDKKGKEKKKKRKERTTEGEASSDDNPRPLLPSESAPSDPPSLSSGQNSILQKLRKSLARTPAPPTTSAPSDPASISAIEPKGLEPLPQPEQTKPIKPLSVLSTLPAWLAHPVTVSPATKVPFADIQGLSEKLVQKLAAQGISEAFAVQAAVLPILLSGRGGENGNAKGDVCIAAATGSGKTLSYVLPIVQDLIPRVVTRLRVVIVVPTRELVSQVNTVALSLCAGSGLKVGVASGARSLSAEQAQLVYPEEKGKAQDDEGDTAKWHRRAKADSSSRIDILITTPGRLVEHVRATPGFSLRWVKWLVIDEADRLLAQSFQEWEGVVMGALESTSGGEEKVGVVDLGDLGLSAQRLGEGVRKVVLSATMTRDVGKLAGLKLRRPTLVVVENEDKDTQMGGVAEEGKEGGDGDGEEGPLEQFSVPSGLVEYAVPVENVEYKPLAMLYLLDMQNIKTGALVFVKSNEGTARLARLVEEVAGTRWRVGMVSGEMEKKRREKVLKKFARGEIDLLICSDLISRGMDLPNVEHIINYDTAASTRAYIHRVGRTARAGKKGHAWTLLAGNEARWFWNNIGGRAVRRTNGIEKVTVEMEAEGLGMRAVYEKVLFGS